MISVLPCLHFIVVSAHGSGLLGNTFKEFYKSTNIQILSQVENILKKLLTFVNFPALSERNTLLNICLTKKLKNFLNSSISSALGNVGCLQICRANVFKIHFLERKGGVHTFFRWSQDIFYWRIWWRLNKGWAPIIFTPEIWVYWKL